jgi:cytochrome c-type biogenesis protein
MASLVALVLAVGAALATVTAVGQPAFWVERLSGTSTTFLQNIGGALPIGYAFGAGMVAAVNPCGFALLPAYLGLYLGSRDRQGGWQAIPRALAISSVVTLSFVLLFGAAGLALSAATSAVTAYFPWAGLVVGVLLILGAGRLVAGRPLYGSLGDRLADQMGATARRRDLWGYAAYGLAYGLASLGCTLPVFLTVVGSALVVQGFLAGLMEFLLYGLGMGFVVAALTIAAAGLKQGALAPIRAFARYAHAVGALLLLVTGAYVVYYWLTLGGLLEQLR